MHTETDMYTHHIPLQGMVQDTHTNAEARTSAWHDKDMEVDSMRSLCGKNWVHENSGGKKTKCKQSEILNDSNLPFTKGKRVFE